MKTIAAASLRTNHQQSPASPIALHPARAPHPLRTSAAVAPALPRTVPEVEHALREVSAPLVARASWQRGVGADTTQTMAATAAVAFARHPSYLETLCTQEEKVCARDGGEYCARMWLVPVEGPARWLRRQDF